MLRNTSILVMIIGALGLSTSLQAADVVLESGPRKTHLLELFTSEGCSSCPPAESWLSKLKDEPRLWRDFVPIAFHVDYWDRLGWRDPFASKRWTARQYEYAARWQSGSVYTPGFVLNGRELRDRRVPSATTDEAGTLGIAVQNGDTISATFAPAANNGRTFELHVARLGSGLSVDVKTGENGGRKLLHDFVVLSLATQRMDGGKAELRLPASAAKQPAAGREAMAAWVTEAGEIEPIQAVGGWL